MYIIQKWKYLKMRVSKVLYQNPVIAPRSMVGIVYQLPGENTGRPTLPDILFRHKEPYK